MNTTIELFEEERATGYNQFVETWIPNYHYFLGCLPKILNDTSPKQLLAVGCGTGNEIERFVQSTDTSLEKWRITGIDPSPEMIQQAQRKFQDEHHVRLIQGVVSDLDLDKKFHAATLLLVLHFLEDDGNKLALLKAIADHLHADAPLVLLDITGDKTQIQQNLHILKQLLPKDLDAELVQQRLYRIENELFAISEQRLSELLQEAGFTAPLRFFQSSIYMGWLTKKK